MSELSEEFKRELCELLKKFDATLEIDDDGTGCFSYSIIAYLEDVSFDFGAIISAEDIVSENENENEDLK